MTKRLEDFIRSLPPERQAVIHKETERLVLEEIRRASIEQGRADARAGRTTEHDAFMAELNTHIGAPFDDWLREEGIHDEVTIRALKNVNAFLLAALDAADARAARLRAVVDAAKAFELARIEADWASRDPRGWGLRDAHERAWAAYAALSAALAALEETEP